EKYGGGAPRREYTGTFGNLGNEIRTINATFQRGYPREPAQGDWREGVDGMRTGYVSRRPEITGYREKLEEIRSELERRQHGQVETFTVEHYSDADVDKLVGLFAQATALAARSVVHRNDMAKAMDDMIDILAKGELDGKTFSDRHTDLARYRHTDFLTERRRLLQIYYRNPALARVMVQRDIVGGHGSTSAALPGVMEHGLRPQQFLEEQGVLIASGEGVFGSAGLNKTNVSFARWFDDDWSEYAGRGTPLTPDRLRSAITTAEAALAEHGPDFIFADSFRITIEHWRQTIAFLEKRDKSPDEQLHADLIG